MRRKIMKFVDEEFYETYPIDYVFAGSGAVQLGGGHRLSFASPGLGGCGTGVAACQVVVSKVLLSTEDLSALANVIAQYLIAITPGEKNGQVEAGALRSRTHDELRTCEPWPNSPRLELEGGATAGTLPGASPSLSHHGGKRSVADRAPAKSGALISPISTDTNSGGGTRDCCSPNSPHSHHNICVPFPRPRP